MNTVKFLNTIPIQKESFAKDISNIRSNLYANGICWTDDAKGNFNPDVPFRVILFTRANQADFKNPMTKECNGLVIQYDPTNKNSHWKLVAMPPRAFCTNKISMKKLNDLFSAGSYDVYEVLDATILTLYFYNVSWRVSSTKGYDIGSTEIVDGVTFIEAIEHLMDTKYKSFKFNDLNKSYSYTIALRYSQYHIFDETKHLANRTKYVPKPGVDMNSYIMVLCVTDTTTMSYLPITVAGLPYQNPITIKDATISSLNNYARSAYSKYAKAHRLQNYKYKPLYGYILRAKTKTVPDEYSTIYIESELYKVIKNGIYKDNAFLRNKAYDKLVVQMSTTHERYEQYRIMFGQFHDRFTHFDFLVKEFAAEVKRRIQNTMSDANPIHHELIDVLVTKFQSDPNVSIGLIKDAMYSKQYISYLYDVMSS